MRKEVEYELSQKNRIYFDITGGESLMLVAFGMLSKEMFCIMTEDLKSLNVKQWYQ